MDQRSGSMHGNRELVRSVRYGASDGKLFFRIEFNAEKSALRDLELRIHPEGTIQLKDAGNVVDIDLPAERAKDGVSFSLWEDDLPIETIPHEGEFRI